MGSRTSLLQTILSAQAATGAGNTVNVDPHRHVIVSIASDGGATADMTVQCQGSIEEAEPDWDSAQAVDNMWDYILMYDYEDATGVDGDTGMVFTGADDYRLFIVNVDGIKWLNFDVTAYAAGAVTVKCRPFTNL